MREGRAWHTQKVAVQIHACAAMLHICNAELNAEAASMPRPNRDLGCARLFLLKSM